MSLLQRLAGWNPFALRASLAQLESNLGRAGETLRAFYDQGRLDQAERLKVAKILVLIGGESAAFKPIPADDPLEMSFKGPMVLCIAESLAEELKRYGAENFLEHTLYHPELGELTFGIQVKAGLTPAEKATKLAAELRRALTSLDLAKERIAQMEQKCNP